VVQNKTIPFIFGDGGTPSSWLAVLDEVAKLNVAHVGPDHSEPGDGSRVAAGRDLTFTIRTPAIALQPQGVAVEAAGKQISADLKKLHPDWLSTDAGGFVKSVYDDPANSR
jgi:hypothetical protein